MKKKYRLLIILLFLLNALQAQEYYIPEKGKKVLIKSELDNFIKSVNYNIENKFKDKPNSVIFSYEIVRSFIRNDSSFHVYRLKPKFFSNRNEKIFTYEDKPFPKFNLKGIKSKRINSAEVKGKVTFINLWFTNCFPCIKEIPFLNTLRKKYKNKVAFLAITYDPKEKVRPFLKKKKFNFTHAVNAGTFLQKTLGVKSYPKIIIIDKEGVTRYVGAGVPVKYDEATGKIRGTVQEDLAYLENILDDLIAK